MIKEIQAINIADLEQNFRMEYCQLLLSYDSWEETRRNFQYWCRMIHVLVSYFQVNSLLLELLHINFPISQESNPSTLLIISQVNPCWNILHGIPLRENCRSPFGGFLFRIFPHWDFMQSNCGKIRTRKTPNTDTSYAVSTEKFSNTVLNLSTNTNFFIVLTTTRLFIAPRR